MFIRTYFYHVLRRIRNKYKGGKACTFKGRTFVKRRSSAYFNVCGNVCIPGSEIFMDKLGTDRCGDFFNGCGKCIFHIKRQTFES